MTRVAVVGAGIIGASIAYHLARGGAAVTVVEKGHPGSGASGASFAWIGKGPTPPRPAQTMLRELVLSDYRRLEHELPDVRLRWTGSVRWDDGDHNQAESSSDVSLIGPDELSRIEPRLLERPSRAEFNRADGALDPVAVVEALIAGAERAGAQVLTDNPVSGWDADGSRIRGLRTAQGHLSADTVVIAAGADSPKLCEDLGVRLPVAASPALLISFTAAPDVVRTLVSNDRIELRQTAEDTFRAACVYNGETTDAELEAVGQDMLARVKAAFSGVDDVRLETVRIGVRPMPEDGDPIIGPLPGVEGAYVAVMHSGVTLAATVGRLVAEEIVTGRPVPELDLVRPR